MASLQQTPITFRSRTPLSTQIPAAQTSKLSLTSAFTTGIKIPKLRIKPRSSSVGKRNRGAGGATMADTAAGSYASALADVATSNNTLEQTAADVEKLERIFSDPEVSEFFNNPTFDDSRKREVLDEIVKSAELQPHVANFVNILVDMKRIELLNDIVKEYEKVYNKLTDTELAVVTSVVQLDSQHLAQIAKGVQRLTGAKNVRIKTVIDPALVAGFTIRYGNSGSKLIDMSVKKQLEDIAAELELGEIQLAV
ncbi:OLC1v1017521C1 [Oldenlandia corymbosa var. corymbosa]|uniref:OLC1v1017521C1 n=1 Tax=Oldenlandia corymbosa var. corymbosa TaxID=529605 RepID=A0AAV1E9M9_OLDCO|nr:OLC1v1017521C1 [Oldenlandia corymbosa var. corymbosa]